MNPSNTTESIIGLTPRVVQPPPGFEHLGPRVIWDRSQQSQDGSESTTSSAETGIATGSPSSESRRSTPPTTAVPTPLASVKAVSSPVNALLAGLPRLDTSGAVHNPQDPGSSASISPLWFPTTDWDLQFFDLAPEEKTETPGPPATSPPTPQPDSGGPTPSSTPGRLSPAARLPPIPFHRRGISDRELKKMMPFRLYKQAKLLDRVLRYQCGLPSRSFDKQVAHLKEHDVELPYVCGENITMLTLQEIEERERIQRSWELEEAKEAVSLRPQTPSTGNTTPSSAVDDDQPPNSAVLISLGGPPAPPPPPPTPPAPAPPPPPPPTTTPSPSQPPILPFHRRDISNAELRAMLPPNLYRQAKLLDSILRQRWPPASVALLREIGAEFPYVCRGRDVEMVTLDQAEDCERLQRELEEMAEEEARRDWEETRPERTWVDEAGMWELPRGRREILETMECLGMPDAIEEVAALYAA